MLLAELSIKCFNKLNPLYETDVCAYNCFSIASKLALVHKSKMSSSYLLSRLLQKDKCQGPLKNRQPICLMSLKKKKVMVSQ